MKVKLLAQYVGPRGVFQAGAVLDLPDVEAEALVAGRYASAISQAPAPVHVAAPVAPVAPVAVETAEAPEPERAVRPAPRAKRKA